MTTRRRRTIERRLPLLCLVAVSGCAYFNGVYNARQAEKAAARAQVAGNDTAAARHFAAAAEKAETVLARHPRSRWRAEALYLSGRGLAHSGRCPQALPRLRAYLAEPAAEPRKAERARLAEAACLVREGAHDEAGALLDSLRRSPRAEIARGAALWTARSAIARGHDDAALAALASTDAATLHWELLRAALDRSDHARAESLLVLRAREGDFRDAALVALRALWSAGRSDGVARIVEAYDGSRARRAARAMLHLELADLLIEARRDSAARHHLLRVRRLTTDTLPAREVAARLALLALRDAPTLAEAQLVVARSAAAARAAPLQRRLEDNLLLVRVLDARSDSTGASRFLAAEVARDSLRAQVLAHTLLLRIATETPEALLAPHALLAARTLRPDSAQAYESRIRGRYGASAAAQLLAGAHAAELPALAQVDSVLRVAWAAAAGTVADSIAARRAPAQAGTPAPSPRSRE